MKFNEEKIKRMARLYLSKARAGDWQHARRAVKWAKELGAGRKDLYLLITATYIHDIGWSGVAPVGKLSLEEVIRLEPQANQNSNHLIEEILTKLDFTKSDINIIKRLVAAADKHHSKQGDEEIVVDADNLCKLSLDHLLQKFQPESLNSIVDVFEHRFAREIKTPKARKLFPKLLEELKKKISSLQNKI